MELLPRPVLGLDSSGAIRLFNREAERLTGLAREELLERPPFDTVFTSASEEDRTRILELLAREGAESAVVVLPTRAGRGRQRHLRWTLVRAPRDAVVVLYAFGEDANADPAPDVAALGTSLAHEIRNPLNGALLHVRVLERALRARGINGECKDALGVVRAEIERLAALVTEFLEYALPTPAQPRRIEASKIVERARAACADRLREAGVALEVEAEGISLWTDAERLERALDELLSNAVEASPAGGSVVLRLGRGAGGVAVEVEDAGPGVSDPSLALFSPFVSTKPKGTGLGLAVVRRIVTDLGGEVCYERRGGRTVFRIFFPDPVVQS
jgi:PAS domain S-box-containing protein